MIRMVHVVAVIVPVIGHGVTDRRATDAANDRADRAADRSARHGAADRSGHRAALIGERNLG
jgi:hypothetical protein